MQRATPRRAGRGRVSCAPLSRRVRPGWSSVGSGGREEGRRGVQEEEWQREVKGALFDAQERRRPNLARSPGARPARAEPFRVYNDLSAWKSCRKVLKCPIVK